MSTPTSLRVWESQFAVYRRVWLSNVLGSFVQPLMFLLGMGVGVGALVDEGGGDASLGGVSYFAFLAPALMATTAMLTGGQASLWETLDHFMYGAQYKAMVATPLTPAEVATGAALWHATRVAIGAGGVAIVLAFFDETRTMALVPAAACAVLTGLAYALPITAYTSTQEDDHSFIAVIRVGFIPMFLFGGAFYPIDELPGWLQPVARITPLWHGIELCRGLVLHTLDLADAAVHLLYLGALAATGWVACRILFARRLLP